MTRALLFTLLLTGVTLPVHTQDRVVGGHVDTHPAAGSLPREVAALASRPSPVWLAYQVPTAGGPEEMCEGRSARTAVRLAPAARMTVVAELDRGLVHRLRIVTDGCDIDAEGAELTWLTGVTSAMSADWLTALIAQAASRPGARDIAGSALAVLAWHDGPQPLATLIAIARRDARPRLRGQALVLLARRASAGVAATITSAVDTDPDAQVRQQALLALSRLPAAEGTPLLIRVAETHASPVVRREAVRWLGRSRDPRALDYLEALLAR